jgi:SAM-dependent methyltransferase
MGLTVNSGEVSSAGDFDSVAQPADTPEPALGDAFGDILVRCHAAGAASWSAVEIAERDDGLLSADDAARYFIGPERWPSTERRACESARGRVLDVGCGAGRHALAMQAAGLEVTGLEPSHGAAVVSRARGVPVAEGTLRNPPDELRGTFDTLLLAGTLGLLATPEDAPVVLAAAASVARPGAQLLGCSLDPYVTDRDEHLRYQRRNRERGLYPGQVRLRVRDGAIATPFFNFLFLSADELRRLAGGTAWRLESYDVEGARCLARLVLR